MTPVAIYVHTPFCPSKCGYCDFNSYAMSGEIVERTVEAICLEIERSPWRARPARTIFFGGGTPTYLESEQLCRILERVIAVHPPVDGCEITSEANPGTVDATKFHAMRSAGFNRISLGAQSFHKEDLVRLGRVHQAEHVAIAVGSARDAGFDNINLDLMFGLPGQSLAAWSRNLDIALQCGAEHLSLYCLTIEQNTRYYKLWQRGLLDLPNDDDQADMYEIAMQETQSAGLQQYEISNFAKPGRECAHNLCCWRAEEYLAYGPGAVGCYEVGDGTRQRYTNMKHPERYCEAVATGGNLWCESEIVDANAIRLETIMLGMRLSVGIDLASVQVDTKAVDHIIDQGWATQNEGRVSLTTAGRHLCNHVVALLA